MAKQIVLRSESGKTLLHLKDHFVDACQSHTLIFSKEGIIVRGILDKLISIDVDKARTRLDFSSGCFLLIKS